MKVLRTIATGILLALMGIIFSLIVIEIGFRIVSPETEVQVAWSDRPSFYYRPEDAATLQDAAYQVPKPANTFRVAVVGDSYTFAPYLQYNDTFPEKLELMLNMNRTALRGEVVNYGVPAYSTTHEVAVVKKALEEQADLVLLQVTLNDAELKPYRPEGITAHMIDRFGIFRVREDSPAIYRYWKSFAFVVGRIYNWQSHRQYGEYFPDIFERDRNWREYAKATKAIVGMCKERGIPLVAVVFPLFGLPIDDSYPFAALHEKIGQYLESLGVAHLDLTEIYRGIPIDRLQVIPGGDRHPNEIAHRMAAEKIYLWLEQNDLLPSELRIKMRYSERLGISGRGLMETQNSQ